MLIDHRNNLRQAIRYPAEIEADGNVRVPCLLQDVSDKGAHILVKTPEAVPDEFVLLLSSHGGAQRSCRVAWRNGQNIGVSFVPAPKAQQGRPKMHARPTD